ncbi:hypothetical protein BJ170DRAFT_90058 [Xylariales sp. AK1849]|nr:hypothetical protein BJ170DRAFT_90058 [Xylariales sp. AK1849]
MRNTCLLPLSNRQCSEGRPTCDQCRTSSRTCRYTLTFGRVPKLRFVNLHLGDGGKPVPSDDDDFAPRVDDSGSSASTTWRIRKTRVAESGDGVFQSFTYKNSRKEPTISREPSCQETRLISRWGYLVAPNGRTNSALNCFGHNISLIPEFFGHSETIHAASVALMDALTAYMDRTPTSRRLSYRSYGKTLKTLQGALDVRSNSREVLVATAMLIISTLSLSPSAFDWAVHIYGQYHLLNVVSRNGTQWDDITQSVFYSCYQVSVLRPLDMASGRDSVFDTPAWLSSPPPSDSWFGGVIGAGTAQQMVMRAMVRIPRLWRLVRQARLHTEDIAARTASIELADKLLSLKLEPWIGRLFHTGVLTAMTHNSMDMPAKSIASISLKFPSVRMLCLLFDYWQSRILICGCIQTLGSLPPIDTLAWPFDLSEVQDTDLSAATNIFACSQQMTELGIESPIARLRWSPSTMNAFSAWSRLEQRERKNMEDADSRAEHEALVVAAVQMQRLLCELMARWIYFWKSSVNAADSQEFHEKLQSHTDFMGGGDVPQHLNHGFNPAHQAVGVPPG